MLSEMQSNRSGLAERAQDSKSCKEIDPANRALLLVHLLGLDRRDKNFRFQCGASDSFITRYFQGINWERHVAIVWRQSGHVIGIAELASLTKSWSQAELAISTAPGFDANNVRRRLFQAACAAARTRGAAEIIIWFASEEDWVSKLAPEYGGVVDCVWQCATIPLHDIENIPNESRAGLMKACSG